MKKEKEEKVLCLEVEEIAKVIEDNSKRSWIIRIRF